VLSAAPHFNEIFVTLSQSYFAKKAS